VRASTRLTEAAKALATRDHVRGISGPSTLPNSFYLIKANPYIFINKDTYSIILTYINNLIFITYTKDKIAALK
jgi:hypothetical protein